MPGSSPIGWVCTPGDYLIEWLGPILHDQLGVRTFADLKIEQADDPGMSLPHDRKYRLVVHTSDITRGELVHLPWDYDHYGCDRDTQDVVAAVRASMSIPFFFEPVTFTALPADVDIPTPGGGVLRTHYDGGTVTWVDGGMLRNFPIDAFVRLDGRRRAGRRSASNCRRSRRRFPADRSATSAFDVAKGCLHTMMNEWDAYSVDASTAARTIFVANAGLTATDFDLTPAQQDELFLNGVSAATEFVMDMAGNGHVPRSAQEATEFLQRVERGEGLR